MVLDNNSWSAREPKSYIYCARVRKSYGPVAWIIASRVGPRIKNQRKKELVAAFSPRPLTSSGAYWPRMSMRVKATMATRPLIFSAMGVQTVGRSSSG